MIQKPGKLEQIVQLLEKYMWDRFNIFWDIWIISFSKFKLLIKIDVFFSNGEGDN